MKGPISIGIGPFLNGFGIRQPLQFEGFEDLIRPTLPIMEWYAAKNIERIGDSWNLTAQGSMPSTAGGILEVPQNEMWYVRTATILVTTTGAQHCRYTLDFFSTTEPSMQPMAEVGDSNPYTGALSATSVVVRLWKPFLLMPGYRLSAKVFNITGAPIAAFGQMSILRFRN
jgi:hypothetical protein